MMPSVFIFLLTVSFLATPSSSATTSFVFGDCSQQKYLPGSPYESKVNSVLTSLVNSAMFSTYNNFTFPGSSSAFSQDTLYGLFQCRGDLSSNDCSQCVARVVSQLGTLCVNSCGGALQLEGCFVKYDNATFLGVEDMTLMVKKCGPSNGFDSDALTDLDAVLANLGTGDGTCKPYRVSGSGNVRGVAQCVGDLSPSDCQDCLSGAVGQLRSGCGTSSWGDIFLAKCYARYSEGGYNSNDGHDHHDDDNNNDDLVKTFALLFGIVAAAALLTVFVCHFWTKLDCDEEGTNQQRTEGTNQQRSKGIYAIYVAWRIIVAWRMVTRSQQGDHLKEVQVNMVEGITFFKEVVEESAVEETDNLPGDGDCPRIAMDYT